ncbi:LysR family transcriptional regulator [Burkholderia vietnamiensis]|uniref:LysR family transcriptional regulator n=1 Tax=Burkholderia vietnamiensis TaxID=60552 RepID=UPI00264FB346|nr:LysR family transcriptional regulator [Burkholderia vietnamiensis]MDN7407995.1 LysR family transcriptional regulator [Burkholderia vietnamiensis]
MALDIKLIEAFAVIVRTGSLTKAETLTGTSKSTLSRHLQRLEEDLGVELIERSSRRVVPTEAGKAFYIRCESLLLEMGGRLELARAEVQELSSGVKGRLCILAENHFTTTFVCHVTRQFLSTYSNVVCELYAAGLPASPRVEDADCYICSEAPDLPNVIAKPVGRLSYGLYASPIYARRQGLPAEPKELVRHERIALREPDHAGQITLHSQQTSHAYISRSIIETNDYWVMKTFCVDGLGIALLPDYFVQPEIRHGSLIPVLPNWKPETRRIFCAYHRQRFGSQKLKSFIDLVAQSIGDIQTFNNYVASSATILPKVPAE